MTHAPRELGLFEQLLCPHCGAPMTSDIGPGGGRAVGVVILFQGLFPRFFCPTHGRVLVEDMPIELQACVRRERLKKLGCGLLVCALVGGVLTWPLWYVLFLRLADMLGGR